MKIAGTRIDLFTGQPKAGAVYLKLIDPPDVAPYRNGDATTGDNGGALPKLGSGGLTTTIQADQQGRFETTLIVNSRTAGDNYQLVGSTNENFDCGARSCPRSAIFTLWKRVYVEEEHMFRRGSFITTRTATGASEIPIEDPTPFRNLAVGAPVRVLHADTDGGGFYAETVRLRAVVQGRSGAWNLLIDANGSEAGLSHAYGAIADPSVPMRAGSIASVLRDAVGVVDGGFYVPDASAVSGLLGSAYVEVRAATAAQVPEVPYVNDLTKAKNIYFASRWLENGRLDQGQIRHAYPNVFHRIGASQAPLRLDQRTGRYGAQLRLTSSAGDTNWSMLFVQRIEDVTAGRVFEGAARRVGTEYLGLDPGSVNLETTAHETVHWWVNEPLGSDGKGHCQSQRYQHDGLNCLMHEPYTGPGLADRLIHLHYELHGQDSEYMTIRRAADPVPQP